MQALEIRTSHHMAKKKKRKNKTAKYLLSATVTVALFEYDGLWHVDNMRW